MRELEGQAGTEGHARVKRRWRERSRETVAWLASSHYTKMEKYQEIWSITSSPNHFSSALTDIMESFAVYSFPNSIF